MKRLQVIFFIINQLQTTGGGGGADRSLSHPSPALEPRVREPSQNPLVVPVEVALVTVADEAGTGEAVELAWIDHQLGRDVQAAQSLVHLLASHQRNVEILVATHEKRWRLDAIRVVERIRELDVGFLRFPRRLEFVVVLMDVLVDSIEHDGVAHTGAAGRRLEARGAGDGVVGENASIAPAANTKTIRIGIAFFDGFIDRGEQVFDFVVSPIGEDGLEYALPRPEPPR